MKRVVAYDKDIVKEYSRITKPFSHRNVFILSKYNKFFKNSKKQKISLFFDRMQQFVVNLVACINKVEKGQNVWSRYFVDLTALLCSGLNIKFRTIMIDNSRSSVDVSTQNLNEVVSDINEIRKIFTTSNNCVIVIPVDYCLLYNISDYIVLIYNMDNRLFDLPHLWESKRLSVKTIKDAKQIKRELKQKEDMENILKRYNEQMELDIFNYDNYIFSNLKLLENKIKKEQEFAIKIDSVAEVIITKNEVKNKFDTSYFYIDIIEEISCGCIVPLIFRKVGINLFNLLMSHRMYLIIKIDRNEMTSLIKTSDQFKNININNSIYNSKMNVVDKKSETVIGSISLATLIHLKYNRKILSSVIKNDLLMPVKSDLMYGDLTTAQHIM